MKAHDRPRSAPGSDRLVGSLVVAAGLLAGPGLPRAGDAPVKAPPAGARGFLGRVELPGEAAGMLFADLDGDRRVDPVVIYADGGGCRLGRIVARDGGPGLDPIPIGPGARLAAPQLADVDGDGTVDLLSTDAKGLVVRRGLGGGRFAARARRLAKGADLLLPTEGCTASEPFTLDVREDGRPELVLPILGGVRVLGIEPSGGVTPATGPAGAASRSVDLISEPLVTLGDSGLAITTPLLRSLGATPGGTWLLGPSTGRSTRMGCSWWTREPGSGSLVSHRTAFALPAGETAVVWRLFDLAGDGRPGLVVVTSPIHLQKLFGEFRLHVFRASDRADVPTSPFFSTTTDINYWQLPRIAYQPAPGGGNLLLAFYRGLMTAHLNVEVFRGDGKGSFDPKPRDFGVESDKKADRGYLRWLDVDGDGTEDLLAEDPKGLRIHRGTGNRDEPVSSAPTWVSDGPVGGAGNLVVGMGEAGAYVGEVGHSGRILRDLDGDGLAEIIVLNQPASASDSSTTTTKAASGAKTAKGAKNATSPGRGDPPIGGSVTIVRLVPPAK